MTRSVWPCSRANSTSGSRPSSLRPRCRTVLSLTGDRPAAAAAAIPSSTRRSGTLVSASAANTVGVEAVEADGDPVQPGVLQPLRAGGEQGAVRGQRDVVDARGGGDLRDEVLEVGAQQRLAAGEPHLADAEPGEGPRPAGRSRRATAPASCGRKTWSGPNSSRGMQ